MSKRKRKTQKRKGKAGVGSILRHYLFLWPSLRTYYTIFIGYFKKGKKGKKKEKIVIFKD
ncbi:hypothetical protein KY349_00480 [Candidatus Woesearchaeota archaeon]|jgi:hypothetical protein|nr:hypothetical protein [Candidatus Woesearchaeota archaeon]